MRRIVRERIRRGSCPSIWFEKEAQCTVDVMEVLEGVDAMQTIRRSLRDTTLFTAASVHDLAPH